MIKPMLAFDGKGDIDAAVALAADGNYVMEPKLDGWRWQVQVDTAGDQLRVRSYGGRNGCEYTGQARHIEDALRFLPPDTVLDGELLSSGPMGPEAPDVSTLLARGGGGLSFVVFDVLRFAGMDLTSWPQWQRREVIDKLDHAFSLSAGLVQLVPQAPVDKDVFETWLHVGFEGAVVKEKHSTYQPAKRSRAWIKIKPQTTGDAKIIGWEPGKGAGNKHLCGALKIVLLGENGLEGGYGGVETSVGYECTPAEAAALIGRQIEYRHHGIQKSGKPKHPVFYRLREDLEPSANQKAAGRTHGVKQVAAAEREQQRRGLGKDRPTAAGAWLRNYSGMGDAKLLQALRELEVGEGDAVDRVVARQGDVARNAARAREAAQARGLI